jgi:hypothetical protein
MNAFAILVSENLNLNMSRLINVALDVNTAVLERRCCFS